MECIDEVIKFIKKLFDSDEILALHQPVFMGNEKRYLNECIDTTFVSSVGKFVDRFENMIKVYTGAKYAIAASMVQQDYMWRSSWLVYREVRK